MGLGLHGGGVGAAKFFVEAGAKVTATDLRTKKLLKESIKKLKGLPIKYVLGQHKEKDFINADLIIRNPAVPDDSKFLKIAKEHGVSIDTDMGIFFELCPAPIIGITGTRGKSTTSTLIYEMLSAHFCHPDPPAGGERSFSDRDSSLRCCFVQNDNGGRRYNKIILAGNIRKSVFLELPRITKNTLVVLELSSWQVEGLAKHRKSPPVAVITNIMPDHLNRYNGMKEYTEAKKLIFKYQTKNDYLFLNQDDYVVKNFSKEAKAKVIFYNKNEAKKYGFDKLAANNLPGKHNLSNIAAAVKVAKHYKVPEEKIKQALKSFKGLEGRIEPIADINNIKYINDTCATTPDATIAAINTVTRNQELGTRSLILIAGGADKNLDFTKLAKLIVKKVKTLILLEGTATDKFEKTIRKELKIRNQKLKIKRVNDMRQAVKLARQESKAGDIVLLSPACASFGLFRHEFERGEQFKKAVNRIKNSLFLRR